jgi:hypothetical protein
MESVCGLKEKTSTGKRKIDKKRIDFAGKAFVVIERVL